LQTFKILGLLKLVKVFANGGQKILTVNPVDPASEPVYFTDYNDPPSGKNVNISLCIIN